MSKHEYLHFMGLIIAGRGMNAAFALAYMCETEEGTIRITDLKECIEFVSYIRNSLFHNVYPPHLHVGLRQKVDE